MTGTSPGRTLVLLGALVVILPAPAPAATQPATAPSRLQESVQEQARILEPSQGRPVILQRAEEFRMLVQLARGLEGSAQILLRHARVPAIVAPLQASGPMTLAGERTGALVLRTPADLPAGLYDLLLRAGDRELVAPRSVKLVDAFRSRFRFVHLSDMSIDDPSAPAFDERLVDEVNLVAPEFIVATGDYTAFARVLDDAASWSRVLAFFARFDAPVYMACGDADHEASFSRYVAASPAGTFDYGRYHGILLLNHAGRPLDDEQTALLRNDLAAHADGAFNFIVSHGDDPGVLSALAPRDELPDYLRRHRLRLMIAGGSDDWDRTEYAAKLEGLDLHYVRTHQSSTALRGRATGVSHYRVFEVDGDRVSYVYSDDSGGAGVEHSVPVGRLRVFTEEQGGPRTLVAVQNALNQRFDDVRLRLRVSKAGDARPEVAGGRLIQALDGGNEWVAEVSTDLPEKGGVKVMVACGVPLPASLAVEARLEGEALLRFHSAHSPDGLSYFESDQRLEIVLRNTSDAEVRTYPLVRLNGSVLPAAADMEEAWPVVLPAKGERALRLRLRLPDASPGDRLLQLQFLEDPVRRLTVFPVTVEIE